MSKPPMLVLVAVLLCAADVAAAATVPAPRRTLTPFASDQEIAATLERWDKEQPRPKGPVGPGVLESVIVTGSYIMSAPAAVTNIQHAGVDEGAIVKVHGEHLVVLRRGRLFTVRIGADELQPVAALDAFAPDIDPEGAWYDELLVAGNTIVVIGYSYVREGSEIGLFDIAANGRLTYRATYHLRSNDYYSSRNYASRLIGDQLIMYAPLYLDQVARDVFGQFPALRRWRGEATSAEDFRRIAPAASIYRIDADMDITAGIALHTVIRCSLSKPELDCNSTAVLGPPGHVFYVSPSAVYVWATAWRTKRRSARSYGSDSGLFRVPLDGSAPSALKVAGSPIDQFSFLEAAGHLNVLVDAKGGGDGMWAAEAGPGELALLRVPLRSFADGEDRVPRRSYRRLPAVREYYPVQNRYVGDYLLYGSGVGWHEPEPVREDAAIQVVRYTQRGRARALHLGHWVDRIEALGSHAVVAGSDGNNLHFSSLRLGRVPAVAGRYVRADAAQGETRSHGFFYQPDSKKSGLLGLPIIGGDESADGQLEHGSAAVLYLRNQALELRELGALPARAGTQPDDACRASCVDWYGNSRPLFLGERVFALLGYEIVEGTLAAGRITERRRIDIAALLRTTPR